MTPKALSRLRRRAAFVYWLESAGAAVALCFCILAIYVVAALLGFGNPWVCAGMLLAAVAAFGFGLSRLRRPGNGIIDRRIENASGLRHRPIAILQDETENDGELTAEIWQIHQRRVAASLVLARSGTPFFNATGRDPLALRGLLLLLLLVGCMIAGPQAMPRMIGAFALPSWPFPGPNVNAWITPPSYTGDPPLVLQTGQTYNVLAGSGITVVVDGENRPPSVLLGANSLNPAALAEHSYRIDAVLNADAKLRVGRWWDKLATFSFNVSQPDGPNISLSTPAMVNRQLILNWQARDRFGLDALTASLTPVGHPQAAAEVFPLPFASLDPRDASGVGKPDIAASPYAGLPVSLVLTARNLAGISRSTAPLIVTLPPRALHDKTALRLAALRQKLALAPGQLETVGALSGNLAQHPPGKISASVDVQMAALARAMLNRETSAADAETMLEGLIKQLESGPDYRPAKALAAAVQSLEQALQQAADGGKPVDSGRLQNLLAAMQAALSQHLQALGQSAANNPASQAMNTSNLNRMAAQIAQDAAAGQNAKAQAELQQLEQILAALQSAKPMSAADAARAAAANQAAQDLNRLTQAESALLDQTNRGNASPGTQAGLRNQLAATRASLARAKIALPGMSDAAGAMGAAQTALTQDNEGSAAQAEASAIQGLQKAAGALAATAQGFSFDAGGQSGAGADSMENGGSGAADESRGTALLPSGGSAAGAIQQQIIKNDADPAVPDDVHQYYHRLLNQDVP